MLGVHAYKIGALPTETPPQQPSLHKKFCYVRQSMPLPADSSADHPIPTGSAHTLVCTIVRHPNLHNFVSLLAALFSSQNSILVFQQPSHVLASQILCVCYCSSWDALCLLGLFIVWTLVAFVHASFCKGGHR